MTQDQTARAPALARLRVEGVPAEMVIASNQHWDDLLHELRLVRSAQSADSGGSTPVRVITLLQDLLGDLEEARMGSTDQARAALAAGQQRVTIDVPMPAGAVPLAEQLLELLDEADRCAAEGLLLTLPAPPAVRGFRRWFLDQMRKTESAAGREDDSATSGGQVAAEVAPVPRAGN